MNCNHSLAVDPPPPSKKSSGIIFRRATRSFLFTAAINCCQKLCQLRLATAGIAREVCAKLAEETQSRSAMDRISLVLILFSSPRFEHLFAVLSEGAN